MSAKEYAFDLVIKKNVGVGAIYGIIRFYSEFPIRDQLDIYNNLTTNKLTIKEFALLKHFIKGTKPDLPRDKKGRFTKRS